MIILLLCALAFAAPFKNYEPNDPPKHGTAAVDEVDPSKVQEIDNKKPSHMFVYPFSVERN